MLLYAYMKEEIQPIKLSIPSLFTYIPIFFIGFVLVYIIRIIYVKLSPQPVFSPSVSTLTLSPPTQSLPGKITASSGIVEKRRREDEDFQPLKDTTIVQGDSLATKQGNIEVLLNNQTSLKFLPSSEVGFVSLLPDSLLFKQVSGIIVYKSLTPFSIRVLHSLIETKGQVTISIVPPFITITSTSGEAKMGFVDLENSTQVYTIKPGETAQINDEMRSVEMQ